jgi:hypothetical protein
MRVPKFIKGAPDPYNITLEYAKVEPHSDYTRANMFPYLWNNALVTNAPVTIPTRPNKGSSQYPPLVRKVCRSILVVAD